MTLEALDPAALSLLVSPRKQIQVAKASNVRACADVCAGAGCCWKHLAQPFEISQISPVRIGGVKLIASLMFVSKQIEQRSANYCPQAKSGPPARFCKWRFIGCQPRPFISVMSKAAFMLQPQSWVVVTETRWATSLKYLLSNPLQKMFVDLGNTR